MNRYCAPLLVATALCLTALPARAHGLPTGLVNFILALLVLTPILPALTDWFLIKRWLLADRAGLAAVFANLAAFAIGIPSFLALQWLSREAATTLELGSASAAYWLRTLSPWLEGLVSIAAMAVAKLAILHWCFGVRLSRPTLGLLFLSTSAGMSAATAVAALIAYASTA
jgi:hypothetical protein